MYKSNWSYLHPFLTSNLEVDDTIPPLMKRRQGRPKTKRIRKSVALQDRQNRCSNPWCRQKGHNKRACTTVEVSEDIVEDSGEEVASDSSKEQGSSHSDNVQEPTESRRKRLHLDRAKRAKAKRRRERALARGEKVPRGRKKKGHRETDQSSSLSSAPSDVSGGTPLTLSEIEVEAADGGASDNSLASRIDAEVIDAIRRGVTPEIVRESRARKALKAVAVAEAIAIAEEERRNDPFRSPTPQEEPLQQPVQPIQPIQLRQTRKRQREQELEEATKAAEIRERAEGEEVEEEANERGIQLQRILTLRSNNRRGEGSRDRKYMS